MINHPEMKERALEFGRTLQSFLQRCAIYPAEHPFTQISREQAFVILTELLRLSGRIVLGFVGDQVLINRTRTSDDSLRPLKQELSRRGVAALIFLPGITAASFNEFVSFFAVNPRLIATQGGAKAYFQQKRFQWVRVVLASEQPQQEAAFRLPVDAEGLFGEDNLLGGRMLRASTTGLQPDDRLEASTVQDDWGAVQRRVQFLLDAALSGAEAEVGELVRIVAALIQESGSKADLTTDGPAERPSALVEDFVARWAADRLSEPREQPETLLAYESVVETLSRILVPDILLRNTLKKLAQLAEARRLDATVVELIAGDLAFSALSLQEQSSELMLIRRYSAAQFRQLMATLRVLLRRGDISAASTLAKSYIAVISEPDVTTEELWRVADIFQLFRNTAGSDFFKAIQPLLLGAYRDIEDGERHQRILHLLSLQAQRALDFQDWDSLHSVVGAIEIKLSDDAHDSCCRVEIDRLEKAANLDNALATLLSPGSVAVSNSSRDAAALCRAFGPRSAENLALRLDSEEDASVRLRLLRLIGQLGEGAIRLIRQKLSDPRWYVVRNACMLLGDLEDPELLTQLSPALTHADERVQMSAVRTLLRKHVVGREEALSKYLPRMHPSVAWVVLEDLMMMRDPSCLLSLRSFLLKGDDKPAALLLKAVQVAALIDSSNTPQLLDEVRTNRHVPALVRQAAAEALQRLAGN